MTDSYFLAIVGCGPRGLFALEQFYLAVSLKAIDNIPKTVVFESSKTLGTGTAWDVEQPDGNWINISDRGLNALPKRKAFTLLDNSFPEFPSYTDWLETVMDHKLSDHKDTFHPRKVMGAYLVQRANSIVERLKSLQVLTVIPERLIDLQSTSSIYKLITASNKKFTSQNVVLTLGHLKTTTSEENEKFITHAKSDSIYFSKDCYSNEAQQIYKTITRKLLDTETTKINQHNSRPLNQDASLAIKGLGLSMIDILRMVVAHNPGKFVAIPDSIYLEYQGINSKLKIVPYSLDGLPSVPKPIGKNIDDHFAIASQREKQLLKKLAQQLYDQVSIDNILKLIAVEIAIVFQQLPQHNYSSTVPQDELVSLVVKWLKDPSIKHDLILDTGIPILAYIKQTCQMAYGVSNFTLDYVIGQTWRQLQPQLYDIYSHRSPISLLSELIKIDEQTKRYSYGPPVESLLQILALEEAGILDLSYVHNPEVTCVNEGYKLTKAKNSIITIAMVDAIIPSPDLYKISDPLVKSLINEKLVEQSSAELGISVDSDCQHLVQNNKVEGIYSLGRTIKGTIYGVDAILECFNTNKIDKCITSLIHKLV